MIDYNSLVHESPSSWALGACFHPLEPPRVSRISAPAHLLCPRELPAPAAMSSRSSFEWEMDMNQETVKLPAGAPLRRAAQRRHAHAYFLQAKIISVCIWVSQARFEPCVFGPNKRQPNARWLAAARTMTLPMAALAAVGSGAAPSGVVTPCPSRPPRAIRRCAKQRADDGCARAGVGGVLAVT